jgi:hypothetical protein
MQLVFQPAQGQVLQQCVPIGLRHLSSSLKRHTLRARPVGGLALGLFGRGIGADAERGRLYEASKRLVAHEMVKISPVRTEKLADYVARRDARERELEEVRWEWWRLVDEMWPIPPTELERILFGFFNAEHDRLAVDRELLRPKLERRLDDPRVAIGPVVAVHGEQAHAVVLAPHQQAVDPMQAQRAESCTS